MDPQVQGISQEGFPTLEDTQKGDQQLTLFSLQDLAINTANSVEQLQEQLKTAREMLSDALKANNEIVANEQTVKDATVALKAAKQVMLRNPEVIALEEKVKSIRAEIKERKETISNSAIEVYRLTGNTEFEKDGAKYQIVTVAKLKKVQQ